MRISLGLMLVCAGLSAGAAVGQQKETLVSTELLADVSAIQPGQTFRVGVLFAIRPEWHIYWINPGDAGQATTVRLTAPAGFAVRQWQYPVPVRFEQPGDIVGYGYTDQVLLVVEVKAPNSLPAGEPIVLPAQASWLACRDVCIPGRSDLKIALPVGREGKPANTELFGTWSSRLPVPADAATREAASVKVAVIAAAGTRGSQQRAKESTFEVTVHWKRPPREVHWFPQTPTTLAVENVEVKTIADQTHVRFQVRALPGQEREADILPGVIAYHDTQGQLRGISVPIHLNGLTIQP